MASHPSWQLVQARCGGAAPRAPCCRLFFIFRGNVQANFASRWSRRVLHQPSRCDASVPGSVFPCRAVSFAAHRRLLRCAFCLFAGLCIGVQRAIRRVQKLFEERAPVVAPLKKNPRKVMQRNAVAPPPPPSFEHAFICPSGLLFVRRRTTAERVERIPSSRRSRLPRHAELHRTHSAAAAAAAVIEGPRSVVSLCTPSSSRKRPGCGGIGCGRGGEKGVGGKCYLWSRRV
jgi:hypothetical protein